MDTETILAARKLALETAFAIENMWGKPKPHQVLANAELFFHFLTNTRLT